MALSRIFTTLILLILLSSHSSVSLARKQDYVKDACKVTVYPALCIHSLSSFAGSAKRSPYRWARAAVSVTLTEAEATQRYLLRLNRIAYMKGRERTALSDCIECFHDTVDQLHNSLTELRTLNRGTFVSKVNNVETWVSAALTNEGSCLDGFSGSRSGMRIRALRSRVMNSSRFTSNALALVNKLASAEG